LLREGCSANQGAAWVLVMTPTVRAVPAKLDTIASMAVNDPRAIVVGDRVVEGQLPQDLAEPGLGHRLNVLAVRRLDLAPERLVRS
jgi:hypothetical protein